MRRETRRALLRPGETCWRVERARRAAFLVDTQAYYAALLEALNSARRSIWILGWAFDPRTRLAPDGREGSNEADEIGQLLIRLTRQNPELDVRLLIWRSSLSMNGSHAFLEHRAKKAFKGTSINYREDGRAPAGACHHQKVIVIDGELAFCGGGDLAANRWDTLGHVHGDPRRIMPHRVRHPPRHDVMMLVEGDAAGALADLFRRRWARSTGERLAADRGPAAWPVNQPAHLSQAEVAIARTEPRRNGRAVVDEIRRLHLACIAGARKAIYLENQYFTSRLLSRALAARLLERDGPEIVLVLSRRSPSWFDRLTMDHARIPVIRELTAADRYGRFRAYYPVTSQGEEIIVHSKVSIADEEIARIGSANLNNRSGGFDTECELAVHARDAATRAEVARLRDVLISHYLGVTEEEFARRRQHGGLIGAIEALNHHARLVPLTVEPASWWSEVTGNHRLGDPASAAESWRLFKGELGVC